MATDEARGVAYPLWKRVIIVELGRQGLAQQDLEKRSGVPRSTINRLKTSKRPPMPRTVAKIAEAVGLDYAEALQLAGLSRPTPEPGLDVRRAIMTDPLLTARAREALLTTYEVLSEQHRDRMESAGYPDVAES